MNYGPENNLPVKYFIFPSCIKAYWFGFLSLVPQRSNLFHAINPDTKITIDELRNQIRIHKP